MIFCVEVTVGDIFLSHIRISPNLCFFYTYWGQCCAGIQNDSYTYFKLYSSSNTVVFCAFGAVTVCLSQTGIVVRISHCDGE